MTKLTLKAVRSLASLVLAMAAVPFAQAQTKPLDQLLARTGVSVTRFLDHLSDVRCHEGVLQEKLNQKGKIEDRVQSSFEYMVLSQNQGDEPMLYESRNAIREPHSKKNISLLVTSGFATQMLIFHPYYQSSFTFERLPDVNVNGKSYAQVHFQHIKGRPTPMALLLRGREYPVSLAGIALIDPDTGAIERVSTELGASMEDLGLKSFRSDVEYSRIDLGPAKAYLLPAEATVEVNTPRQHWKNVHRFTDYRLFSVSTTESVDVDKIKDVDKIMQKDQ